MACLFPYRERRNSLENKKTRVLKGGPNDKTLIYSMATNLFITECILRAVATFRMKDDFFVCKQHYYMDKCGKWANC